MASPSSSSQDIAAAAPTQPEVAAAGGNAAACDTSWTERELSERTERSDRVRLAGRALRWVDAAHEHLPGTDALRELAQALRFVAEAALQHGSGRLPPFCVPTATLIDRSLAEFAKQVLDVFEQASLAQLRSTLPRVRGKYPEEVAALLDLCLDAPERIPRFWSAFEYLITLLSSEDRNGRREVTHDPVRLTDRMQAYCAGLPELPLEELEDLCAYFGNATGGMAQVTDLRPVVHELRAFKTRHLQKLLVPAILRALVDCNVALGNRLDTLIEAESILEDAERALPAEPREPDTAALGSTLLRIESIDAVRRGLATRLSGEALAPGPVCDLVEQLDVEPLDRRECELLMLDECSEDEESLCAAIVLGLIAARQGEVFPMLAELALEPETLRSWLPGLEAELRDAIQRSLRAGNYAGAQKLAESKSKFLPSWIVQSPERAQQRRTRSTALDDTPRQEAAPESAEERRAVLDDWGRQRLMRAQLRSELHTQPAHVTRRRRSGLRIQHVQIQIVVLALCTAIWGMSTLSFRAGETVKPVDAAVLARISPHLAEGFRGGMGQGNTLLGTFADSWLAIPDDQRRDAGLEVAQNLRSLGIDQALVLDGHRRVQLRYSSGSLEYPR